MAKFKDISDEIFINAVNDSNSITDVLEKLGYSRASGSMWTLVKKRIKLMELDTSHFNPYKRENTSRPKYTLEEIMVENSKYENIDRLKKRIIKEGLLEYKCSKCGNTGEWNGEKLVLQLEHKNGIHNDHRLENLEFLCPNCHSQTKTYSGRNIGRYKN